MRRNIAILNNFVASFQDAALPTVHAIPTLRSFVACTGLLGFRAVGTRDPETYMQMKFIGYRLPVWLPQCDSPTTRDNPTTPAS